MFSQAYDPYLILGSNTKALEIYKRTQQGGGGNKAGDEELNKAN